MKGALFIHNSADTIDREDAIEYIQRHACLSTATNRRTYRHLLVRLASTLAFRSETVLRSFCRSNTGASSPANPNATPRRLYGLLKVTSLTFNWVTCFVLVVHNSPLAVLVVVSTLSLSGPPDSLYMNRCLPRRARDKSGVPGITPRHHACLTGIEPVLASCAGITGSVPRLRRRYRTVGSAPRAGITGSAPRLCRRYRPAASASRAGITPTSMVSNRDVCRTSPWST